MRYRTDIKTNNRLSALGFGCMRFPNNPESAENLILEAFKSGINYFDTAYLYRNNEATLGSILEKHSLREKVYIATKLPIYLIRNTSDFDKYFNIEIERLRTNYIDYYLMHMIAGPEQWTNLCALGIEKWIADKKQSGAIRQIGFSFHGPSDNFSKLLEAYPWDFCQIQYNYSDENFQAGVQGLKKAASMGIPVIIMEPLLGGKLATGLSPDALNAFREANPSLSPAAWGLRWLLNQPEVTVILSGMNQIEQLTENIATVDNMEIGALTEEELKVIENVRDIFRASNKIPCTGCAYCIPCPRHVNIPGCFSAYNAYFTMGAKTGNALYQTSIAALAEQETRASLCISCKKCEAHCPQGIKISEELKNVSALMEPWWFYHGLKVLRFVLGKNKKKQK